MLYVTVVYILIIVVSLCVQPINGDGRSLRIEITTNVKSDRGEFALSLFPNVYSDIWKFLIRYGTQFRLSRLVCL